MEDNIALLNQLYKNVKMGEETISALIPSAQSEAMRGALEKQRSGYSKFSQKLRQELQNHQAEPKKFNAMTKMSAEIGIKMNTMIDKTDSHVADMMVQGSTMGITEATKGLHNHKNACQPARQLAKEIVAFEQQSIEAMKHFL